LKCPAFPLPPISVERAGEPMPTPREDGRTSEQVPAVADLLGQMADKVDGWLSPHEHSTAVSRWAALLAGTLGYDDAFARSVALAGRLHDIGKIVVPEAILTKPAKLTNDEWRLLRQHPEHGAQLACLVPGFGVAAEIIGQHHERFDGAGYPRQLAGPAIRIEARIVAVCDCWAAMRSDRAYRAALSVEGAREQLRLGRSGQFDPEVVDAFLDLQWRGRIGELARLSQSSMSAKVFQNISS
jgi:two-component system cell cycle response regulator